MPDDPRSEFERIFGATQRVGETKSPEDDAVRGATQRLPSDSDVLGIRTDSDRFLLKHVPERLPIDPQKEDAPSSQKSDLPKDLATEPGKSSADAMTIALNVNVFANLADTKVGDGRSGSTIASDERTFVIPFPKQASKAASEIARLSANKAKEETNAAPVETEFTRILHVQDTITVPKPTPQPKPNEAVSAFIAAEQKAQPSVPPQPIDSSSGPSDFTKVVKGSELRAIQERLAGMPTPQAGTPQQWQPASAPAVPQYVPAQNANWPTPHPTPHPSAPAHPQSKMSQYMPLIIALNVLFILAILLIVFFAVKK